MLASISCPRFLHCVYYVLRPRTGNQFESRFFKAIQAITLSQRASEVASFFPLVSDFGGIRNRYGQKAVPDFFEYLFARSPSLSHLLRFTFSSQLTCSKCHWVSERLCDEVCAKLHIPPGRTQMNLQDLVDYNFNTTLDGKDSVFCGNCRCKTTQQQRQTLNPDVSLVEIVRAKEVNGYWSKNNASISFPLNDIKLPGFSRAYRVVGTCHHRGTTANSGHWTTKELISNGGWYELDDIKGKSLLTSPPGVMDGSVTLILLIAEDKFRNS